MVSIELLAVSRRYVLDAASRPAPGRLRAAPGTPVPVGRRHSRRGSGGRPAHRARPPATHTPAAGSHRARSRLDPHHRPVQHRQPQNDYDVPDGGLHHTRIWGTQRRPGTRIVSPGDEAWTKLQFYAAHQVDELLIVAAETNRRLARAGTRRISADRSQPPDQPRLGRARRPDRLARGRPSSHSAHSTPRATGPPRPQR
jgi:hypothetical protein